MTEGLDSNILDSFVSSSRAQDPKRHLRSRCKHEDSRRVFFGQLLARISEERHPGGHLRRHVRYPQCWPAGRTSQPRFQPRVIGHVVKMEDGWPFAFRNLAFCRQVHSSRLFSHDAPLGSIVIFRSNPLSQVVPNPCFGPRTREMHLALRSHQSVNHKFTTILSHSPRHTQSTTRALDLPNFDFTGSNVSRSLRYKSVRKISPSISVS